jgi:hypothetical protein
MDTDKPNRASNMEKAEGDRETITNTESPRRSEWGEGTSSGGGVANRPMAEDVEQQEGAPDGSVKNDALGG